MTLLKGSPKPRSLFFACLSLDVSANYLIMSLPTPVFFLRGLSTYGRDSAKWSVFDFGPFHSHFQSKLEKRGLQFIPVLGMGSGTLPQITKRATLSIEAHPVWLTNDPVHILAHSAGGLAARLLVHDLEQKRPGKIASLLTIASPHRGSRLSEICVSMPQTHKGSALMLRSLGYDVGSRRQFFEELRRENVQRLFANQRYLAATASIVCSETRDNWCLPLKMFQAVKAFREFDLPSDGVVERDSQPFGKVIAELKIDHFRQVGFFGQPHRFEQMCDVIARYYKNGFQ